MTLLERLELRGRRLFVTPARTAVGEAVGRLAASRGASAARGAPCELLVTVSAPGPLRPFLELSPDEWDAALAGHVTAVFERCREVVPSMVARGEGRVVNVVLGGTLGLDEAVLGLTKALARELAPAGVRVNAVTAAEAAPEAVAELALFLLSDAAGYVTGATLAAG